MYIKTSSYFQKESYYRMSKTFLYFQKESYYRMLKTFGETFLYFQKELYYRSEGFVHTIRRSEGNVHNDLLTISEGIILYIRRNYT